MYDKIAAYAFQIHKNKFPVFFTPWTIFIHVKRKKAKKERIWQFLFLKPSKTQFDFPPS